MNLNRPTLQLKIVKYLCEHGPTTTVDLSTKFMVPRSTLQAAIKELRRTGVLEPAAQGTRGGIKLACLPSELTCGSVLGEPWRKLRDAGYSFLGYNA